MAGGLYGRVQSRGFPSSVAAGQTGAGALESQGGPQNPAHADSAPGPGTQTLAGFEPDTPPAPAVVILEGSWGLPGQHLDPDQTPGYGPGTFRTHAAPMPGWAGSYYPGPDLDTLHENSREIHAADFGGRQLWEGNSDVTELPMHPWASNSPGEAAGLVPLTGPQRVLGHADAVQGYDLRNRFGFDAGHRERLEITGNVVNAYLDPAERPFIVPQASGTFTPTDTVQGPGSYHSFLDAGNVSYDDPSAYQPPPEPPTLAGQLVAAPASAGWV
jgi:hypothetical protein